MKILILALALIVAAPTTASAQNAIRLKNRQANFERLSGEFRLQQLGPQQSTWRAARNARAVRRAEAAAELINAGDCTGATALAERARDRALLAGIARVCGSADVTGPIEFG